MSSTNEEAVSQLLLRQIAARDFTTLQILKAEDYPSLPSIPNTRSFKAIFQSFLDGSTRLDEIAWEELGDENLTDAIIKVLTDHAKNCERGFVVSVLKLDGLITSSPLFSSDLVVKELEIEGGLGALLASPFCARLASFLCETRSLR